MLGSTLWLTLATLTGLTAGFAREWLLIASWGASSQSDAFLISLFLPEALRMALAAGLISAAALPLYHERKESAQEQWLGAMAPRFLLAGVAISIIFSLFAPLWVRLIGPGLSFEAHVQAAENLQLLAWCAPGFLLHALFSVPLQARSRFVLAGFGSLLFNLPAVIYLALYGQAALPQGVAKCCALGSLLMPIVLIPTLYRAGWRPWQWHYNPGIGRELLKSIGPLLASNLTSQGLALLERMVASLLGEGAVAWVNLARKLINLPLIALMSLNQVLLGMMSKTSGQQRKTLLDRGLNSATLLTLPAALGLIGATPALVSLLFPEQPKSSHLSGLLAWFAVPLLFGAWNSLLARYAYADGDTRMPFNCELAGGLLNALLLATLPFIFGTPGIAMAMLGGIILTNLLLMRRQKLLSELPWGRQWFMATVTLGLSALILHPISNLWLQLAASTLCGLFAILALAFWLRPWQEQQRI